MEVGTKTFSLLKGPRADVFSPLRHTKATAFKRKGSCNKEAPETETLLPQQRGKRGPLLRAIWQVGRSAFLLGTLSLIISDVFRFTVPKLLRWVQALGALLRLVVPERCPSRTWRAFNPPSTPAWTSGAQGTEGG